MGQNARVGSSRLPGLVTKQAVEFPQVYTACMASYRRSTIIHCHLIFVGRGENEN